MAVVWPSNLPQSPQWREYSEDQQDNVIRTDMDTGLAKVRKRFTAVSRFFNIKLNLTSDEADDLIDFFDNDCNFGTTEFEWKDFRSGTSGIEYRFLTRPVYKSDSPTDYNTTFQIERLP